MKIKRLLLAALASTALAMSAQEQADTSALVGDTLQEVTVRASKVQMVWKGDTIQFDATAFNVPEGSMLDELIRRLPGVQLKDNGEIMVNGRRVDYLTLNGKDFFKGDNKVMLDNLPNYTVKSLHVYDKTTELSEYLGHDYEKKEYVMDVRLKKEYRTGILANAEAAAGTNDRYLGRGFGLRYTDHSRLTLIGNANNVNESRKPGSNGEWSPSNTLRGEQTRRDVYADLSVDDKDKRWKNEGGVSVRWAKTENESRSANANYLEGAQSFVRSWNSDQTRTTSLALNNSFTLLKPFRLEVKSAVDWQPHVKSQSNVRHALFDADPSFFGSTMQVLDSLLMRSSASLQSLALNSVLDDSRMTSHSLHLNQYVRLAKSLPWGHDFFVHAQADYRNGDADFDRQRNQDYYRGQQTDDHRNIFQPQGSRSTSLEGHAEYVVNLRSGWHFLTYYHFTHTDTKEDDRYYWNGTFHPSNSVWKDYHANSHRIGPRCYYYKQDSQKYLWFNVHLPMTFAHEREGYLRVPIDTLVRRHTFTFNPDMTFIYQDYPHHNYYHVTASRSTSTPDIVGLTGYRNEEDPLAIILANPHLKPSHTYHLSGTYQHSVPQHEQVLSLAAQADITHRALTQSYAYNPTTGGYIYQQRNIDGTWQANLATSFSRSLDSRKHWRFYKGLTLSYRQLPQYTESTTTAALPSGWAGSDAVATKQTTRLYDLSENFNFTYRLNDRFDLTPYLDLHHIRTTCTLATYHPQNYTELDYGFRLHYTFSLPFLGETGKDFNLSTDLTRYTRHGYDSPDMNTRHLIWNIQLTKPLCHGRLVTRITAFDLLGQTSHIYATYTSTGMTSIWYRSLHRYAMLSVQWKFQKNPTK